MKLKHIKTIVQVGMVSAAIAALAACGGSPVETVSVQAEPQVVVVRATPRPTPTASPTTAPVETATAPAVPSQAGTLLKGSGDGVFYLTEDGTRQHIYNMETFRAFGFNEQNIMLIDDTSLAAIPLSGELTRLVTDREGKLYWIAAGQRWPVNEWQAVVTQEDYQGVLVTPLDGSLQAKIPARAELGAGSLLRESDVVYYLEGETLIPVPAGAYNEAEVIDVPSGILAAYDQRAQLEQVEARLNAETPAANLRQGPGLEYSVIKTIERAEVPLTVVGRNEARTWLEVMVDETQRGWLAAGLVEANLALSLLPVSQAVVEVTTDLPQAQPAAATEASELQPLYCTDVPIRGFGAVWGEHLEVQNTLGCPYSWQGAEQGTKAALQIFEHGLMIWLESDSAYSGDPVYVFFADGSYQRFGDLGSADPEKVGPVPAGFYEVGDKFSKVYWEGTGARVEERLGYATSEASDSAGAFQQFSNGRMFWLEGLDRIFVIYDYGYYNENDEYIQVRTWESYEDKF